MNHGMDERGFTLVELLVVILVIGILAALALPTFIGQADKAHDAASKADVRNAVSHMEACFVRPESYDPCPDEQDPLAPGVTVAVTEDGTGYVVRKMSETDTIFTITRDSSGVTRTCTQPGEGGCGNDSSW